MTDTRATAEDPVAEAARRAIDTAVATAVGPEGRTRVAVALSGGRDSMALLDALVRVAPSRPVTLSALHVHHGLSSRADDWAAFCAEQCAARGVPLAVVRVQVGRKGGSSLEAAARAARYDALAGAAAEFVALAHHADDQAETLLLQLLRGAGPHGLAAMPAHRAMRSGPALLRPFLDLTRAAIDVYVQRRGVRWVDDDSNANTGVRRNYVRHEVAPRLAVAFPGYPHTVSRSASLQAETARLLDDLATLDAKHAFVGGADSAPLLDRAALIALAAGAPHRARNLLRFFLREHRLPAPSAARLAAMLDQLTRAPPDARVRLAHGGVEIGFHRGHVAVHAPAVAPFAVAWHGESSLALPHGTLEFTTDGDADVGRAALDGALVTVRTRVGGERIRLAADRPRRSLKRLMQEAGMPPWQRGSLPLVYCGDALAVVPGLGIDVAWKAVEGRPGYSVRWRPAPPEV
jgi:tRNA(Ile)-lysidine synthase